MQKIPLQRVPLIFIITLFVAYSWFYTYPTFLNNFGQNMPEWPLLLDTFLVIPFVCFVCLPTKKQAAVKTIAYIAIAILFGAYFVPAQQKFIWLYLEQARYGVLALVLFVEFVVITSVIFAVRAELSTSADPDDSLTQP